MTDETRAKISVAHLGLKASSETRAKMSKSQMGNTAHCGCKASPETRMKLSVAHRGLLRSPQTCARLSTALKGRIPSEACQDAARKANLGSHHSPEHKAKIVAACMGKNWKGGTQVVNARQHAKRRILGYVYLNPRFAGCEGHHVDNDQVIHMPKSLHHSVYHRQDTGQGMAAINAIAYNFLFKQEVEAVLGGRHV